MRELLIATRSQKKMPELLAGLEGAPFKVISLNETSLDTDFVVEEPGNTYEAHAAIKAFTYGKRAGMLTLADDSGLEVDALGGWPGVHSATHLAGSDHDRMMALLERMKDVPDDKRTARFRSTIALYDPQDDKIRFAEGIVEGKILLEPSGGYDYGYNPVFFANDLQKSFGDSTLEEMHGVSHRSRALIKAREVLLTEFV